MTTHISSLLVVGTLAVATACSSNAAFEPNSSRSDERQQHTVSTAANAGRIADAAAPAMDETNTPEQRVVAGESVTADNLSKLSDTELARLRNTVYARHGRTFRTPELQKYFDSRPWYRANASYSDSLLTQADRDNLTLLEGLARAGSTRSDEVRGMKADAAQTASMRKLIKAMRDKDVEAFLALLPRQSPWRHSSTMVSPGSPPDAETYSYEDTANELRKREGLYIRLFVNDLTDSFAGNYLETDVMWRAKGDRFVPPGASAASPPKVYVKWREEGDKLVLDEIAYPYS